MNKLFTARTTDGNSSAIDWNGGGCCVHFFGTWDSSTATLQVSFDGGTSWAAVSSAMTKTADGYAREILPPGCKVRANLASAGASTEVNVWVLQG